MSPTTLRIIIALILFVHGVGHVMGILPAVGLSTLESWNTRSWLLTGFLGDTGSRVVAFILFLAATIGFIGTTLAFLDWLVPHDWWQNLAIVSAIISLVAVILFWNALVSLVPNKVGAIAVDVAILVGLLWANWPTEAVLGYQ